MSRIFRLLICLSLATALLAPTTVLATPADDASSPWWAALAQLWSHVFAPLSDGDGIDMGPDIDPDGFNTTTSDDGDTGNAGPDIDPDGLTVLPTGNAGGPAGPEIDPHG